jgi:hypothetical protein
MSEVIGETVLLEPFFSSKFSSFQIVSDVVWLENLFLVLKEILEQCIITCVAASEHLNSFYFLFIKVHGIF